MRRILWLIPKCPLPAQDGSRVAIKALIKGLTGLGEKIDLLLLPAKDEEVNFSSLREELGVRNIYVIRRESSNILSLIKALFTKPLLPITVTKYASKQIKEGINNLLQSLTVSKLSSFDEVDERGSWNIVVYEGVHSAAFASSYGLYKALDSFHTIYRAENCEADLWKLRAEQEKNPLIKLLLKYQYLRMRLFEESVVKKVGGVATVSADDIAALGAGELCKNCVTVPIARNFDIQTRKREDGDKIELLFVGRLDWLPNKDGLKWFLENVWEDAFKANPKLHLRIIGSGDGSWLRPFARMSGVEFLGKVAELDTYYHGCDAVIVPVFYGSGTRVKVIEAASYAKACIGTELGVSGLGFVPSQHYLKAEKIVEWKTVLESLDLGNLEIIGKNSSELLCKDFSVESAAKKFLTLVEKVMG